MNHLDTRPSVQRQLCTGIVIAACLFVSAGELAAQENTVHLGSGSGYESKFLTTNQVDTWILEVEAGETIIADVRSREFDPVLRLVDPDGVVLREVDDLGSESGFACRAESAGEFQIQVHAFELQGGGNYNLDINRFVATEASVGVPTDGSFGDHWRAYHRWTGSAGDIIVLSVRGARVDAVYDPSGDFLDRWEGAATLPADGEYVVVLDGSPRASYRLELQDATLRELPLGLSTRVEMSAGGLDVWTFGAEAGQVRLLEVSSRVALYTRVIPLVATTDTALRLDDAIDPIRFLPISSKGDAVRYVALIRETGPFQLQVLSREPRSTRYDVQMTNPVVPLGSTDTERADVLPVGATHYYQFEVDESRLVRLDLMSQAFDAQLQLLDTTGVSLDSDDDGGVNLDSMIRRLLTPGSYLLAASSRGDGGGGDYSVALTLEEMPVVAVGERTSGELGRGGREIWALTGVGGSSVFVSVRSSVLDPTVQVLSPSGVSLGYDSDAGVGTASLLAVELPDDGRYLIVVESSSGSGQYELRVIDGD